MWDMAFMFLGRNQEMADKQCHVFVKQNVFRCENLSSALGALGMLDVLVFSGTVVVRGGIVLSLGFHACAWPSVDCHIPILEVSRSRRARILDLRVSMKTLWMFWVEGAWVCVCGGGWWLSGLKGPLQNRGLPSVVEDLGGLWVLRQGRQRGILPSGDDLV